MKELIKDTHLCIGLFLMRLVAVSPVIKRYTRLLLCGFSSLMLLAGCGGGEKWDDSAVLFDPKGLITQLNIPLKGSLQNAAWSPDGNSIVFTRFMEGYNSGAADIMVFNLAEESMRTLVSDGSTNVNLPGSTWNPVTHQIVFSSAREPHDEVFIIDETGGSGDEIKVTQRPDLVAYEPSLSPDGEWVVFEKHRLDVAGNGVLEKYRIDGTAPYQRLTGLNDDCRQPNWSPDGSRILYQAFNNGQWDIWTVNSDGTNRRQVTSGAGDKTDASFSPDGQWIVYSADGPALSFAKLFIMHLSGGTPVQVTFSDTYDGAPSWSPDGTRIVYESYPGDPDSSPGTTLWVVDVPPL